ncbi:hypothetical protein [Nesterenkonia xinjiangensis]|uniref:Uncharacterized protein n=1 Tax=Nesterenkonia xinjiangensis TaxID=225327 RepID=A0A7Z0GLU2_9MICC|nr:hypothetical protein [Nesterenkonia xinjiangensis]NYJ78252.1 hypothetical protein [Nesterenkonia xinjiangensis]
MNPSTPEHLPGNPFDDNVKALRKNVGLIDLDLDPVELPALMQAEAAMALAYEQRTANLIAIWQHLDPGATANRLYREIQQRSRTDATQEAP